jgi:hypothetical protein
MSNNPNVQINIKALVEFNKALVAFSSKLNESFSEMDQSLKRLGENWKDEKYIEFKNEFSEHVKKLKPLSDDLKRYRDHSEKHWIPIIQKFLNTRA